MRQAARVSALLALALSARIAQADAPVVDAEAPVLTSPGLHSDGAGVQVVAVADSPGAFELVLEVRLSDTWHTLCATPCTVPFSAVASYRLTAPGIRPTAAFKLEPSGHEIRLVVHPATVKRYWTGISFAMFGATGIVTGALMALLATSPPNLDGLFDASELTVEWGYIIMGIGVAVVGAGLAIAGTGYHSGLDLSFGASPASSTLHLFDPVALLSKVQQPTIAQPYVPFVFGTF